MHMCNMYMCMCMRMLCMHMHMRMCMCMHCGTRLTKLVAPKFVLRTETTKNVVPGGAQQMISGILPGGNDFKRRAPPRSALEVPSWNIDTLLPTAPPTRIYLRLSHVSGQGRVQVRVLAFADLDEDTTVGGLKTLVYERLMLGPNQAVILSSWGRALDETKRLCDLSLPTNAQLEIRLALCALDPSRGLERLRVTSTCLSTRRVAADMQTTVLEFKHAIQEELMKGTHEWWGKDDGVRLPVSGTTLLAMTSQPADEKQMTDEISQGEELIVENKLHLQGGKGACKTYRIATGEICEAPAAEMHILDLKPECMTLLWTGRALADDEVLFELGLRQDDPIVLEFTSPVTPNELALMRKPVEVKEKKADGGAKGKKKK